MFYESYVILTVVLVDEHVFVAPTKYFRIRFQNIYENGVQVASLYGTLNKYM